MQHLKDFRWRYQLLIQSLANPKEQVKLQPTVSKQFTTQLKYDNKYNYIYYEQNDVVECSNSKERQQNEENDVENANAIKNTEQDLFRLHLQCKDTVKYYDIALYIYFQLLSKLCELQRQNIQHNDLQLSDFMVTYDLRLVLVQIDCKLPSESDESSNHTENLSNIRKKFGKQNKSISWSNRTNEQQECINNFHCNTQFAGRCLFQLLCGQSSKLLTSNINFNLFQNQQILYLPINIFSPCIPKCLTNLVDASFALSQCCLSFSKLRDLTFQSYLELQQPIINTVNYFAKIRICFAGEYRVGKTSFLRQMSHYYFLEQPSIVHRDLNFEYTDNEYKNKANYEKSGIFGKDSCIEQNYTQERLPNQQDHIILLEFVDILGTEQRNSSIIDSVFRNVNLCFLVYNKMNEVSYERLDWWADRVRRCAGDEKTTFLCVSSGEGNVDCEKLLQDAVRECLRNGSVQKEEIRMMMKKEKGCCQ